MNVPVLQRWPLLWLLLCVGMTRISWDPWGQPSARSIPTRRIRSLRRGCRRCRKRRAIRYRRVCTSRAHTQTLVGLSSISIWPIATSMRAILRTIVLLAWLLVRGLVVVGLVLTRLVMVGLVLLLCGWVVRGRLARLVAIVGLVRLRLVVLGLLMGLVVVMMVVVLSSMWSLLWVGLLTLLGLSLLLFSLELLSDCVLVFGVLQSQLGRHTCVGLLLHEPGVLHAQHG